MKIKIPLFVLIILNICKSYLSQDEQLTSCKATETEVTVTPTASEDIIKFLNFDVDLTQLISDTVTIQTPILQESLSGSNVYDEDQDLNATDLITKNGFTPEVHEVTTKDGYKLTMHRIVGNGPVVFMMHGIMCSTDEWITARPENSLAFELASAGYDVWMGNARGTKYSRKHSSISPECDEFWELSWDQISVIDVPTMIDYALNFTGKSNLSYVGFSQGATNVLALCSDIPEYNEKISLAVLLAPAVYCSHWETPVFRVVSLNPEALYKFTQLIGLNNPATGTELQSIVTESFCGNNPLRKVVCSNILGIGFGYGRGELDIARLPVFSSHLLAGASIRQIIHFGQLGRTGKFQKFNFTKDKNLEVYGSEEPPEYKLEKVTASVAIFRAEYDLTVHPTDLNQLVDELPNVVNITHLKNFGHPEHLFGKNCKEFQNQPIVELISKYQN